ncbi:MAG: hypothetical protein MUP76_10085 [Acidimicrobiia bacterium]|nr:hypothetical protein [Acidimicrobiia bacterium]
MLANGQRGLCMLYGYAGKILHVDLTDSEITVEEPTEDFYRMDHRRDRSLIVRRMSILVLALALATFGCSDDGGDGDGDGGGGGTVTSGVPGVVLTVFVADEVVATWTIESLESAVEFVTLTIDGDEQSGPRVLDVLAASGVTEWETAEVLGKGEGRSFDIGVDISAADVDEGWLFDVTNRGTLKLVAEELPREQWVRDAGEIRIP